MLAAPDDANYRRCCSPLELLNLDYIQHFSYGARLYARPSERSERLKLFVVLLAWLVTFIFYLREIFLLQ